MHVIKNEMTEHRIEVYAIQALPRLGDLYPVGNGATEIISRLAREGKRVVGERFYWRQPLDRPAMGNTIRFAAYVDREGSFHLRADFLKRKLDRGMSLFDREVGHGAKAAGWVWPEITWRPGLDLFGTFTRDTRSMLDVLDADPLETQNWNVFGDSILDDASISDIDRQRVQRRVRQATDAIKSLRGYEERAREIARQNAEILAARRASETYEERERRERGQRLNPDDYPATEGVTV